jgi:hypothetical protein
MWSSLLAVPLTATTKSGRNGLGVCRDGVSSTTKVNAVAFLDPPDEGSMCSCVVNSSPSDGILEEVSMYTPAAHFQAIEMTSASNWELDYAMSFSAPGQYPCTE